MLGDLILWVNKFWNQQTCLHQYKWIYRKDTGGSFAKCSNCKKIKD